MVWTCAGHDLKLPSSSGTSRSTHSSKRTKGESREENNVSDRVLSHSIVEKENLGIVGCGAENEGEVAANLPVTLDGEEGDEKVEEELQPLTLRTPLMGHCNHSPLLKKNRFKLT